MIINGDFNAKTSNEDDFIIPDKFNDDTDTHYREHLRKRNSQDKNLDERGKNILDMCKGLDLSIINGRKTGDVFGNFTCFQWNGNSVVDYLITSEQLFKKIPNFKVGEFIPWLSDHCPLIFSLELNKTEKVSSTNNMNDGPKHFTWSDKGKNDFFNQLNNPDTLNQIENITTLHTNDPIKMVSGLTKILIKTAKEAKINTVEKKKKNTENPPWFNNSCEELKSEIKSLGKEICRDPHNVSLKQQLTRLKRKLKKTVQKNKWEYKNTLIQKMSWSKKESKTFWKLLDKLDKKKDDNVFKEGISGERWVSHFISISNKKEGMTNTFPSNTKSKGKLDYEITIDEIKLGAYILRNGKAPGHDSISNEMIASLLSTKPEVIKALFNAVLQHPSVISTWSMSMILPIHKKGSKMNPENYRGISLLSCFGKFFTAILNQRLLTFAIENKILSNAQLGFMPGNRTSDALLILYNLINFYCHKNKNHIFGCFVDFQKAFDKVPRYTLFQKLLNYDINGNFYNCLVNLYLEDKACIKVGNQISNFFSRTQGVKQGCILSPLLFNIFLSDFQKDIEKEENEPIDIAPGDPMGCIIWADDILLLSKSELGLSNMLKTLKTYTEKNGMSINLDKTKVMIFNKNGRHIRKSFPYGENKIESTRQYKYLGLLITPSGEINSGLKDLKDRALKAFMKVKKKMGLLFQKFPLVSLKVFETLVRPILLYASDFWGILNPPRNNPVENIHYMFCKHLLGVQKQTTNIGVLLELGQIPLNLYAKKMAIKNWERISLQKKANNLVLKSYEFAIEENLNWPNLIQNKLAEIGMMQSFAGDSNIHEKAFSRMRDIFHQEAFAAISTESSKLRTYKLIKGEIGFERYLTTVNNIKTRTTLTKFRLSNHTLMIEKGRHQNIDKKHRFCPFCPNCIEDEMHFLLECKCFATHRKELFLSIDEKIRDNNMHFHNKIEKFINLLSNIDIIPLTAQYLVKAFHTREHLLENHKNFT